VSSRAPLDGIRIISLAGQYPGPYATVLLADLGADVVSVERPDDGDPVRAFDSFVATANRDKSSVAIDLKSQDGRADLMELIATADVVIDGFRPGVLERLGVSYDLLKGVSPRLVIVSAIGYGPMGPYATGPGHDLTYRAEAGMLMIDDRLKRSYLPIADILGAHAIVESVLVGLLTRNEDDAAFDASLFDTRISALGIDLEPLWTQGGPGGFPAEPGYGTYETRNGKSVALGVAHEDKFWQALWDVLGLKGKRNLNGMRRIAKRDGLSRRIAERVATRQASSLESRLLALDVPFGRVRTAQEIADHPQVLGRQLCGTISGTERISVRQPITINGRALSKGMRIAPALGEDDLAEFGRCRTVRKARGRTIAVTEEGGLGRYLTCVDKGHAESGDHID